MMHYIHEKAHYFQGKPWSESFLRLCVVARPPGGCVVHRPHSVSGLLGKGRRTRLVVVQMASLALLIFILAFRIIVHPLDFLC